MFGLEAILLASILVTVASLLFSPTPKIQNANKPNLSENDFPNVDETKKVPEVFGTIKISPTIISFGNIREIPFSKKIDGGFFNSDKNQIIGYSIFADLAFAIGTTIDKLKSVVIDDEIIANIPSGTNKFSFQSAKASDSNEGIPNGTFNTGAFKWAIPNKSKPGKSLAKFYNGYQTVYDLDMLRMTGYPIIYNGISYVVVPSMYLGDGATNIPNISFIVCRTKLFNNTILNAYADINNGQANPAICLLYILKKFIGLNDNMIDFDNFVYVAEKLYNKKIGISFSLSSVDEAQKWITEILRHISGTINFNKKTGKYQIKLMDSDYNYNTLKEITDSDTLDTKFFKSDWSEAYTSVTYSYTDPNTFKSVDITKTNMAMELLSNSVRKIDVQMMAISNHQTANKLADLELKKYSYPRASIKFKVHNSFELDLNDVFKYSSQKLGLSEVVFRVMSIGGDEFEKEYIEIEAIEDLYNLGNYETIESSEPVSYLNDYTINSNIGHYNKIIYTGQDLAGSADASMLFFVSNNDDSVISNKTYGISTQYTENIDRTTIILSVGNDDGYLIDEMIVNRNDYMVEVELSDREWQLGQILIAIENEILSIKSIEFIDENTAKLSNIIRNINSNSEIIDSSLFVTSRAFLIGTNQGELKYLTIPMYSNTYNYNIKFNLSNKKNKTVNFITPIGNYNNFHNTPSPVSYVFHDSTLKTLEWDITGFLNYKNSVTTVNIDSIDLNTLIENKRLDNQYFDLYVKYKNHTIEEHLGLVTNTFSLQHEKQLEYCIVYNIINGYKSVEHIYYPEE